MNIAVDFDMVIHDRTRVEPGFKMGLPIEGAKEALKDMRRKGNRIIIHTVRGGSPKHVEDWLKFYQIPYDEVTNVKPNDVAFFIDDHALRFEGDWVATMAEMDRLNGIYQSNKAQ